MRSLALLPGRGSVLTMSSAQISEHDFEQVADQTLRKLLDALDKVDDLEADLQMGVLTIEHADGVRYVVNSHRAARQIWLAAERNAWHFDYEPSKGAWLATKDAAELLQTVESVLSRKIGKPISLSS